MNSPASYKKRESYKTCENDPLSDVRIGSAGLSGSRDSR